AYGTSSGTTPTPSTEYFNANYKAFSGLDPGTPAAVQAYDAGAIVGLAVAQAGKPESAAIKDAIRRVVAANGTVIHAGKVEFAKALALIKDGQPIKYEGVIGPVQFDEYGDITGPFRLWRIKDGEIVTVGEMSTADVDAIKKKIGQ
ncbi:MAG: amino acid ABC transporter substrate-binding protein, partial [Methylobacteriaceae bacterium]|nr:amino acid ABC transporter substrate-binding protein [Methylobacteriaceae bacterium]